MLLPALYHWSPKDRREDIMRDGLKPYSMPVCHGAGVGELKFAYICFSPTPSGAWGLSGDIDGNFEDTISEWDLWQVRLAEGDEVHYRADWGPWLREVRVHTAIPANRVWYVATRETGTLPAIEIKKAMKRAPRKKNAK
jgi:hypothetical protein